jgi:hypothetical protein
MKSRKAASKAALKAKKCQNFKRCGRKAKSSRAKFCLPCFKENGAAKARIGGGNSRGNPGNAGNSQGKGIPYNAGNSQGKGNPGNAGNSQGKGVTGNSGNATTGQKKKLAGKRSALRRSTKMLLVVKNPWLDLILSRKKSWEIRDAQTKQRGKIHLALSGAGGRIAGQCHITDSFAIDKGKLGKNFPKHRIKDLALITYRRPHVWVLEKARRYKKPFVYSHPQGAIKWVKL